MENKTIQQCLINYNQAEVVIDDEVYKIDEIDGLNKVLDIMLQDSRTMPAFGVSLHNETIKAMQNGVWLKLCYNKTECANEMPFDTLLVQVEPNWSGFNIIRGNSGKYEGRCYYVDLDGTMQHLYDWLRNLK